MKSLKFLLHSGAVSLLLAGALAQAAHVTGVVTNKTTGKLAAGDPVVLVDVQAGMEEVARTTTDTSYRYKLNLTSNGPYLIRVNHALESEKISGTIKTKTALETVLRWTPIRT